MSLPLSELITRYERLSSPLVYDVLDQLGHPNQALAAEIRPLAPEMVVAGPAFTIEGCDSRVGLMNISSYQMFRDVVPDSVMVMAMNGHHMSAPWGENSSISARHSGARGIILDGATRDANAVAARGFPTFCRFLTPVFSQGRFTLTAYQTPIQMPGQVCETVSVTPGDFVMADRDGTVIVPKALIETVLLAAEKLAEIEQLIRAALESGEDREAVYKRYPKFDHLRANRVTLSGEMVDETRPL